MALDTYLKVEGEGWNLESLNGIEWAELVDGFEDWDTAIKMIQGENFGFKDPVLELLFNNFDDHKKWRLVRRSMSVALSPYDLLAKLLKGEEFDKIFSEGESKYFGPNKIFVREAVGDLDI